MTTDPMREAFEKWYYDQWSHGETTHVHHAHKAGCWMAWQAALSQPCTEDVLLPYDVEVDGVRFSKGVKLETFINAAKRWKEQAALAACQPRMSEEQAVIEMAEALCDEAERNGDIDEIPFVDAKILCRAAYRALLAAMNNPASLAPNPDKQVPLVRKTDEGDAQIASMNGHAAPVDVQGGGDNVLLAKLPSTQ